MIIIHDVDGQASARRRVYHPVPVGHVRQVWIDGPAGRLEGSVREAEAPRAAAVFAHPHPLYGGTLHNPVVFHADRETNQAGLMTVRFNFRGVGASEGEHDRGNGEVRDVAAAAEWIRELVPGVPLVIVGYSFGAWCGLRYAVDEPAVAGFVGIGLPVRHFDFSVIERFERPVAVVHGSEDELGSPEEVERVLAAARPRPRLDILEGATHLFSGRAPEVGQRVAQSIVALLDG
jgi:alpha/beta superfamily hydrolase